MFRGDDERSTQAIERPRPAVTTTRNHLSNSHGREPITKRDDELEVERCITSSTETYHHCCMLAGVLRKPTEAIDGGWSWVVCVACFGINFFVLGTFASYGVLYVGLLKYYIDYNSTSSFCETGRNEGAISASTAWIGNQAVLIAYLLGPFSSSLVAQWGVRPVIMVGSVLFSVGAFLTAATNSVWQAIVTYGIIMGVGCSLVVVPSSGILPLYFNRRKAFAMGLSRSATWIAGLCMVPVHQAVLDQLGWRWVCLLIGSYGLLIFVCGTMYRPRVQVQDKPRLTAKQIIIQACNTQRHARFTVWAWLAAAHYFALYMVFNHLARHAECKVGVDGTDAALLLTYISVVGAVSGIVAGYVGDYVTNRIPLLQLSIFVCGITNLCFPLFKTYNHLIGYCILFGISGYYGSLVAIIPRDIVGLKEALNAWAIYGMIAGINASAGGPFGGWMYDATGSYNAAFCFSGGVSVVAGFLMFSDIYLKRRQERLERTKAVKNYEESVVITYETTV